MTTREDPEGASPALPDREDLHSTFAERKLLEYRPPKIERLGDVRSTVLGGSPGIGDSTPVNTNPLM